MIFKIIDKKEIINNMLFPKKWILLINLETKKIQMLNLMTKKDYEVWFDSDNNKELLLLNKTTFLEILNEKNIIPYLKTYKFILLKDEYKNDINDIQDEHVFSNLIIKPKQYLEISHINDPSIEVRTDGDWFSPKNKLEKILRKEKNNIFTEVILEDTSSSSGNWTGSYIYETESTTTIGGFSQDNYLGDFVFNYCDIIEIDKECSNEKTYNNIREIWTYMALIYSGQIDISERYNSIWEKYKYAFWI